jgi:hypothetical protein
MWPGAGHLHLSINRWSTIVHVTAEALCAALRADGAALCVACRHG